MARKNTNTEATQPPQTQVNPNQETAPDYESYLRSRCGGALRTAREKQGLSLNDVAAKLKISTKQIEAIEADDFSKLPEAIIVRGFIRNYAKLLKLDTEPLLDAYNVLVPNKEPLAFMVKPTSTMRVGTYQKPKIGQFLVLSILLVLALAAWFFYQHYIQKPSPVAPTASVEKLEPLPEQALPMAERVVEQSTELTLPPAPSQETLPVQPDAAITPSATNNAQAILAPANAVSTVVADNELIRLEIAAKQESWVSVTNAEGKQIYSKNIFAGSRETVDAKPPVELVVGNAMGTSLTVNGKAVDLAPHTRTNVARLKLE